MNICLISRSLPLHRSGGLEYHTLGLARGLVKRGHRVVIVTTALPCAEPPPEYEGITLEPLPGSAPSCYNLHFFKSIPRFVQHLHRQHNFDVIHGQGFGALTVNPEKFGVHLVITIHGTIFSETALAKPAWRHLTVPEKLQALGHHKSRILLYPLYRRMLKRAAGIIVDSAFTRDEILKSQAVLRDKIRVVPLSVEPERFPEIEPQAAREVLGLPTDRMILFTVGRLHKMKGFQTVIEALHEIGTPALDRANALYVIGGSGDYAERLQRLVDKYSLSGRVKFAGRIKEDELATYYAAADVFIYPDMGQPAFGLVALESLLCGTPVIGASSGAIPEVVDESVGALFPPGDSHALADLLRNIVNLPQWVQDRKTRARAHALRKFPFDAMIDNTIEIYHRR